MQFDDLNARTDAAKSGILAPRVRMEKISPGTATLITEYNSLLDGDYVLIVDVQWLTPDRELRGARAVVDKGGHPPRYITFKASP